MEKLLNFSCEIGRQLMQNGAEIYRVEESIQRILRAYGCERADVFAIPACIIVNIRKDGENHIRLVRIKTGSINLHKLGELNALSREVCETVPEVEEAERKLAEILERDGYSVKVSYLAHALVAGFFAFFWGGHLLDALVAGVCGLLVKKIVGTMQRMQTNGFFTNLVAAMFAALLPVLLAWAGIKLNVDKVVIGTIMLLVPGISITNMMRDILAGDFLTAVTRMAEILIVALGITVGVALAIMVPDLLFGIMR